MSFVFDEPNKKPPLRKGAKMIGARKVIGDCEVGDTIRFSDGAPLVERPERKTVTAPSDVGKVVRYQGDTAVVRFVCGEGETHWYGEPEYVVGNPRIIRLEGYR
jgi:hypothetical protein